MMKPRGSSKSICCLINAKAFGGGDENQETFIEEERKDIRELLTQWEVVIAGRIMSFMDSLTVALLTWCGCGPRK